MPHPHHSRRHGVDAKPQAAGLDNYMPSKEFADVLRNPVLKKNMSLCSNNILWNAVQLYDCSGEDSVPGFLQWRSCFYSQAFSLGCSSIRWWSCPCGICKVSSLDFSFFPQGSGSQARPGCRWWKTSSGNDVWTLCCTILYLLQEPVRCLMFPPFASRISAQIIILDR